MQSQRDANHRTKNRGRPLQAPSALVIRSRDQKLGGDSYCFLVPFLAPFLAGRAGFFFASPSLPPISVRESAALNGNCRTECSGLPAAFRVTSTRRLLAHLRIMIRLRALCRSSGVSSGLFWIACFTSSM